MTRNGVGARPPTRQLGGVARSVVLVGASTALGQGALIVASPVLARLYSPEAFGLLSVYAAVLGVLLAVSSLRFDMAIPIADDDAEAVDLLAFSIVVALGSTIVLSIALLLWGGQLAGLIGAPQLAPFLWLLPVAMFVAGVSQCLAAWAVYRRAFPALGRMRAIQGLTQAVAQIGLGILSAGSGGLIVGDVIGRILGTEQLLRPLVETLRKTRIDMSAALRHARSRWGFARVMAVASLLNALSLQLPFLLIPGLFDLESSGQYFLAYRVLVLPAALVGAAVSQVFFGEASSRRDDPQRLHDMAINVAVSLLVFAIPTYAIVIVAGPILIALLFGPQWELAGTYAQLMAPGLILWSVASPISSLLLVGRRERESLAFTVAELLLKVGAVMAGAMLASMTLAVAALSVAAIVINLGALWRILRVASASVADLIRPALRVTVVTLPCVVIVMLARPLPPIGILAVAGAAWAFSVVLAARLSPEVRALLSGSHD